MPRPSNGVECPRCHAAPGTDCVKVTTSPRVAGRIGRVGQTAERNHIQRIEKYEQVIGLPGTTSRVATERRAAHSSEVAGALGSGGTGSPKMGTKRYISASERCRVLAEGLALWARRMDTGGRDAGFDLVEGQWADWKKRYGDRMADYVVSRQSTMFDDCLNMKWED